MPELNEKVVLEHFTESYSRARQKLQENYKVKEVLTSSDARDILPNVIIDVMREAAEPLAVVSKYFPEIRTGEANSIEFPAVGVMRARFVDEAQEYPEQHLDFQKLRSTNDFKTRKVGILVRITEEMINDSLWDVIGLHLRKGGEAMMRFKEEWCFREFSKYGHIVFDNSLATAAAHTTGVNASGLPNNTLSPFDFIDMYTALLNNGYTPTTLMMHPLTWATFVKTDILGGLGQTLMQAGQNYAYPVKNIQLGPDAANIGSKLPYTLEIVLSPYVPIDRVNRTFDLYMLDRSNIGAMLIKYDMQTEEFDEPLRDIRVLKIREKYMPGVFDYGRAIIIAKKVSLSPSYPKPMAVKVI